MGWFTTAKIGIKIVDFAINLGGYAKKAWKSFKRKRNENRVEKAINNSSIDDVESIVQRIKQKRADRRNKS